MRLSIVMAALSFLAMPSISISSDLPRESASVTCINGSFVAPNNERPVHYHTDALLLTYANNIPNDVLARIKQCDAQAHGAGQTIYLPLPYITAKGPWKRKVLVVMCMRDSAYLYQGVMAARTNFVHRFTRKEQVSLSDPIARKYCK